MKNLLKILSYIWFCFPVVFYLTAKLYPDFLLSLPRPFSDFQSGPVALWFFIVLPIILGFVFLMLSKFIKSPK